MNQAQIATLAQVVTVAITHALKQMNAQQPKAAKQAKPASKAQPKPTSTDDRKAAFAAKVVETFKAKGITVEPHVTALTYGKWEAKGFRPKTGERATFVKTKDMTGHGIPLFHVGQVEKIA